MRSTAAAVILAVAGCSGGGNSGTHHSPRAVTAPPSGWSTLFSRDGTRGLYDNGGRDGSFTVQINQQIELVTWADGDVQHLIACLVRVDDTPPDQCYSPRFGSDAYAVTLHSSQARRSFFNGVPPGRYTVAVSIDGAATWHVRIFGQS